MKSKSNLFLILSFLFSCSAYTKAYDGPKLPQDQIARIKINKADPIEIITQVEPGPGEIAKYRGWRAKRGGPSPEIIEVLPGTYIIKYKVYFGVHQKINTEKITVEAGHTYTVDCNNKTGECWFGEKNS